MALPRDRATGQKELLSLRPPMLLFPQKIPKRLAEQAAPPWPPILGHADLSHQVAAGAGTHASTLVALNYDQFYDWMKPF